MDIATRGASCALCSEIAIPRPRKSRRVNRLRGSLVVLSLRRKNKGRLGDRCELHRDARGHLEFAADHHAGSPDEG